jgi:hypothetical protein
VTIEQAITELATIEPKERELWLKVNKSSEATQKIQDQWHELYTRADKLRTFLKLHDETGKP